MSEQDWINLQSELQHLKELYKGLVPFYKDVTVNSIVTSNNIVNPGTKIAEGLKDTDLLTITIEDQSWASSCACLFGDVKADLHGTKIELRAESYLYLKRDGDALYAGSINAPLSVRVFKQ